MEFQIWAVLLWAVVFKAEFVLPAKDVDPVVASIVKFFSSGSRNVVGLELKSKPALTKAKIDLANCAHPSSISTGDPCKPKEEVMGEFIRKWRNNVNETGADRLRMIAAQAKIQDFILINEQSCFPTANCTNGTCICEEMDSEANTLFPNLKDKCQTHTQANRTTNCTTQAEASRAETVASIDKTDESSGSSTKSNPRFKNTGTMVSTSAWIPIAVCVLSGGSLILQ